LNYGDFFNFHFNLLIYIDILFIERYDEYYNKRKDKYEYWLRNISYKKEMHEFTKSWIISSLLYLASIFCYALFYTDAYTKFVSADLYLVLNLLNLYLILYLLHGCCLMDNIPYKKFWDSYALLLLIYGILLIALDIHRIILALPFYLYQIVLLTDIVYTVLRKWRFSIRIKVLSSLLFFACVVVAINSNLYVMFHLFPISLLLINISLLLMLNFTFTMLYHHISRLNQNIQENYLYELAENAVDIVFYYTLQPYPRFTFISPSVETIVGYKQAEFYKNPMLHIELTHEEDRDIIRRAFSLEAVSVNKNFIRWQRKDGDFIYLEFHNTPIFSGEKLIAIEGILRDITDRKLVEQEMLDSKKSKQILLSYISHELKTPITYIVGYAEALQKNLFEKEEDKQNAIDLISQKSIFLQKLVDDLFQLSKMETNQFSFQFMQTKVYRLYKILDEKYHNDVTNKNLEYKTMIDQELIDERYEVLVDIKRIEQVFSNILHNAIKHTPEKGSIACRCVIDEKKENIIFMIIDSGSGIPKHELPYIFNMFYKGRNTGAKSIEGSGLGLSLSRQIIEAHKGKIEAQSSKDKGTTVSFSIPLYTLEA